MILLVPVKKGFRGIVITNFVFVSNALIIPILKMNKKLIFHVANDSIKYKFTFIKLISDIGTFPGGPGSPGSPLCPFRPSIPGSPLSP